MPRKQNPPGKEKWTWDEINAGYKMSKTTKRYRRLAVGLGATKLRDERLQPPSATHPEYYLIFGALLITIILALVFQTLK